MAQHASGRIGVPFYRGRMKVFELSLSQSRRGWLATTAASRAFDHVCRVAAGPWLSPPLPGIHRLRSPPSGRPPSVQRVERRHGRGSRCCALWLMRGPQAAPPVIAWPCGGRVASEPQNPLAIVEIGQQRPRGALMEHRAAFECENAVGEGEYEVEIVLDDHDGEVPAEFIEYLEQLECDRGREPLEGFVEQQQSDIAGHRAADRDHLLLAA